MGGAWTRNHQRLSPFANLIFPALTITLGLQLMRVMFPALVMNKRAPDAAAEVAAIALCTFVLAFAAPLLPRWIGLRRALIVSAGGIALVRVVLQLVDQADARIWVASAGVLLFLWFVPAYLGYMRGLNRAPNLGAVILAGLAFDTALQGLFGTWDYAWTIAGGTLALAVGLSAAHLLSLRRFVNSIEPAAGGDVRLADALPLAGLGPVLFVQAIVIQNVARHSAILQITTPDAFLFVMFGNAVGLLLVSLLSLLRGAIVLRASVFVALVALILAVVVTTAPWPFTILPANAAVAMLLELIGRSLYRPGDGRASSGTAIAWGMGMLVFVLLVTVYYVAYERLLPFENDLLIFVAIGLSGLAAWGAVEVARGASTPVAHGVSFGIGVLLMIAPIVYRVVAPNRSPPAESVSFPVRVMSYNIHMGFNVDGWADMNALARTIEASGADIVALQEVSRGWYINGSIDTLEWLARRLNMHYAFEGTADPVWGNAVLSRFRISRHGSLPLPEASVRPRRGLLWVEFQSGSSNPLLVIATHLHHDESGPRLAQIPVVLQEYRRRPDAYRVVVGDMNATPDSAEYALFSGVGLTDGYRLGGGDSGSGFTYRADNPTVRIDYIWLSPDLLVDGFRVLDGTASDHRGIAATIGP